MKRKNHNTGHLTLDTGFTLIELLVVVAIIGILVTLVFANLNSARQRARDAQRKSDLNNIATALRLYYNDFGKYPGASGTQIAGCGVLGTTACDWGTSFAAGQVYMSYLPNDPLASSDPANSYTYEYVDDDNFRLNATLENAGDPALPISQQKCGSGSSATYVVCP